MRGEGGGLFPPSSLLYDTLHLTFGEAMSLIEATRSALAALRANLLRSALTLLGMVIGVFAVIASVTAVEVIDVYFQEALQIYGGSTFNVERKGGWEGGQRNEVPDITYEHALRLKRRAGAGLTVSIQESFGRGEKVRSGGNATEGGTTLYGSDDNFLGNFGYELARGRPITERDVQHARNVALLGKEVADALFPNAAPLGKQITIGRVRLQVVGVLAEKGGFLNMSFDNRVVAPISTLAEAYGTQGRNIGDLSIKTAGFEAMQAGKQAVISHMRVIRGLGPAEDNDFEIESNATIQEEAEQFTSVLTTGGVGIGLISLLAAGIGIMNIMLVSVTERTREIGIRKAVGARRRDIMRQFLIEAVVMCQIGGLIGIGLGAAFSNAIALYFDFSAVFPWAWAVGGAAAVTAIALLFGGYPAWKAARLDPIESLRYE
jgi:putative ABC transport system permease protein